MYNNRVFQNENFEQKQSFKSTPKKIINSFERKSNESVINEKINEKLNNLTYKTEEIQQNIQTELSEVKSQLLKHSIEKEELNSEINSLKNQFNIFSIKMNQFDKMEVEINRLSIENKRINEEIKITKKFINTSTKNNDEEIINCINKAILEVKEPIEKRIRDLNKTISLNYNKRFDNLNEILNKLYVSEREEKTKLYLKNESREYSSQGFDDEIESGSDESESSEEEEIEEDDYKVTKSESINPLAKSLFSPNATSNPIKSKPSIFEGLKIGANLEQKSIFGNMSSDNKVNLKIEEKSAPTSMKPSLIGNQNTENSKEVKSLLFGNSSIDNKNIFVKFGNGNSTNEVKPTMFGNIQASVKPTLFGNTQAEVKPTLFGSSSTAVTSSTESKSLFGTSQNEDKSTFGNDVQAEVKGSQVELKHTLFGTTKVGVKPTLFGNTQPVVKPTLFGSSSTCVTTESKSLFGTCQNEEKPIFENDVKVSQSDVKPTLFGSTQAGVNSSLFGSSSKQGGTGFLFSKKEDLESSLPFGTKSNNQSFVSFAADNKEKEFGTLAETTWEAGPKLFSSKPKEEGDSVGENEVDEHDPQFKPIIALPPLVEIVKDDDNKKVLFKNRCKLYRFDTEWKERGVGDIKILKSLVDGTVTMMMRREMVHKLCCNQLITKDSHKFTSMGSDKSTCWPGTDFSEGKSVIEKFAVKFNDKSIMDEFKRIIAEVQNAL